MREHIISTGSVTYAAKGRDALRSAGIGARIERKSSNAGCGYTIVTDGDIDKVREILDGHGVKILGIK